MLQSFLSLDEHAFFLINGMHSLLADYFFLLITQLGNGWFVAPLLLALVWRNVPKSQFVKVIVISVIGLSLCGIVNSQLKKVFKRSRPPKHFAVQKTRTETLNNHGNRLSLKQVRVVGPKHMNKSFPSGHTNTAFSAAVFLVVLFGRWYLLALIPAMLVGYSRIYLGVHFPLDVVVGAALGSVQIAIYLLIVLKFVDDVEPVAIEEVPSVTVQEAS